MSNITMEQRKSWVADYSEAHQAFTDIADSLLSLSEMLDSKTGEQLELSASGRQGLAKMIMVFYNSLWDRGLNNLPLPDTFAKMCGVKTDKEAAE